MTKIFQFKAHSYDMHLMHANAKDCCGAEN